MKRIAAFCFVGALLTLLLGVIAPAAGPEYGFSGGGPSIGLFMPDLSKINEFVTGIGFASLDGSLFLIGGGGRGGLLPALWAGGPAGARGSSHGRAINTRNTASDSADSTWAMPWAATTARRWSSVWCLG
ncbi:hypothetical protein KJ567_02060 [Candidatus Bipolaricaulota bacterium]|nr:hypothetical protein [Candidatus Bipolaricaulota bacterium]